MALFQLITAGNTTINLDATNNVVVTQTYGMGMPPMANQVSEYALLDGGSFQRSKAAPRVMMMQIEAVGNALTSTQGLHTIRARLLNAVNPHRSSLPVRVNYTGNGSTRYINAYYEAGLEGGDLAGFTEQMTLRLVAPDPYWYANTAASGTAPVNETMTLRHIARWDDGVWSSLGGGADINGDVLALVPKPGGGVYAGGYFDTMGGGAAKKVAVLDSATTNTWAPLGAGLSDATVPTMWGGAVAPNGNLYVGGEFGKAGNTAANNIAMRDISANCWVALGNGVNNIVDAIVIDRTGLVYVSGTFSTAGNTAATYVASWDGSKWSALGSGVAGGTVMALAVDNDNNLYAAGSFDTAGGAAAASIAKWDGATWSTLGSGITAGVGGVRALAYDQTAGYLYAGGDFNTAGGATVKNIARWNGRSWGALGEGVDGWVDEMIVLRNGWLLCGGDFDHAGGVTAHSVALWNGYSWVPIPAKIVEDWAEKNEVRALAEDAATGAWYIGGAFGGTYDTAELVSGHKIITNSGGARAYPVITFAASAASQRLRYIRNDTTNQTLWFDYLMQDGETITIDCRPGHKAVTSSYYGTAVGNNPLPGSQLATFCLAPGANDISILVDGSNTTATIEWTPTFWSID